jgi:hypothetical protein
MYIGTICTVDPTAPATTNLIYLLKVVGSWFARVPYDHLPVLAHETDFGRFALIYRFRFIWHGASVAWDQGACKRLTFQTTRLLFLEHGGTILPIQVR